MGSKLTNQERYAIAKSQGDTAGMKAANDAEISAKLLSGAITQDQVAANTASQDIANTQAEVDAVKANPSAVSTASSGSGTSSNDYSNYLSDLYSAKEAAALAELESAYNSNVAALDASAAKITPTYQAAKNETASDSELAKRNFAEYAAASGLNSGAGGQAELARNTTLQGNLNTLNTAEADAKSDVELQRTQLANEYNTAIASAKASGDYELASALYQESVRVDEALASQALSQAGLDYQNKTFNYGVQQDTQNAATSKADTEYNNKLNMAQLMAQYGDFSGYEAMGIDTTQMKKAYAQQQALASAKTAGGSSSGSPSGATQDYDGLFAAAAASPYPESYIANNYKKYGFTSTSGLTDAFSKWDPNGGGNAAVPAMTDSEFSSFLNSFGRQYASSNSTAVAEQIYSLYASGRLTDAQYSRLVSMFGLS